MKWIKVKGRLPDKLIICLTEDNKYFAHNNKDYWNKDWLENYLYGYWRDVLKCKIIKYAEIQTPAESEKENELLEEAFKIIMEYIDYADSLSLNVIPWAKKYCELKGIKLKIPNGWSNK
jgi:hypothetical protein